MNKKRLYYFVLPFFAIVVITGCKKYGNDAKFTLRTPMNRITGTWEMTKYEIEGIDSTQFLEFRGNNKFVVDKKEITIFGTIDKFEWRFGSKKTSINTEYPFYPIDKFVDTVIGVDTTFYSFFPSSNRFWDIVELSNKKLVIYQVFGQKTNSNPNVPVSYIQEHQITFQKTVK